MIGRGLDDIQDWVASWSASVSERAERTQQLAARVAEVSASASGAGGLIEVRVDSSGVLTGLRLDERITDWPAARIEQAVLDTMRAAHAALVDMIATAVGDTVGMDSETGRAVTSGYAERFTTGPDRSSENGDERDR